MVKVSDPLKPWWEAFPYDAVKAEMDGVQEQINTLSQRLMELQDAIRLADRYRKPTETAGQIVPMIEQEIPEQRPPLRGAIRQVMETRLGGWPTNELRESLIKRGWLRDDAQGKANLLSMLSIMTTKGQLMRLRTGVYALPGTVIIHERTNEEP